MPYCCHIHRENDAQHRELSGRLNAALERTVEGMSFISACHRSCLTPIRLAHPPPQVVAATLPLLMRAGSGILVSGWKAEIVRDEGQSGYTLFTANGNRLQETSNVSSLIARCHVMYDEMR